MPFRTKSRANRDRPRLKMGDGHISKLSAETKYSVRLANVEKQELGNIVHQFYGEQRNTKKSRTLSPDTLNGVPLRNWNITVNMT